MEPLRLSPRRRQVDTAVTGSVHVFCEMMSNSSVCLWIAECGLDQMTGTRWVKGPWDPWARKPRRQVWVVRFYEQRKDNLCCSSKTTIIMASEWMNEPIESFSLFTGWTKHRHKGRFSFLTDMSVRNCNDFEKCLYLITYAVCFMLGGQRSQSDLLGQCVADEGSMKGFTLPLTLNLSLSHGESLATDGGMCMWHQRASLPAQAWHTERYILGAAYYWWQKKPQEVSY